LFGAPIAHEDHAVRACYAALALQDGMRRYAERVRREHGALVEARVGLNSGEVIVRLLSDDLHMDYTAMGQTVHLAARMEQLAKPDTAALTVETLRWWKGTSRSDRSARCRSGGSPNRSRPTSLSGPGSPARACRWSPLVA